MNQQPGAPVSGKSSSLKWLLIILVIVIVLGGGYLLWVKYGGTLTSTTSAIPTPMVSASISPSTTMSASNKYSSSLFGGFSFTIPTGYVIQVEEIGEGGPGEIITFGKKTNDLVSEYNFVSMRVTNAGKSTLDSLKAEYIKEQGSDILNTIPIKIAGTDAVRYEIGGFASGYHIIGTNGTMLIDVNNYPSENASFITQILSTFQFTP